MSLRLGIKLLSSNKTMVNIECFCITAVYSPPSRRQRKGETGNTAQSILYELLFETALLRSILEECNCFLRRG